MKHMSGYVTYVEVRLSPSSDQPEHLTTELKDKGWKPVWGRYDYAYYWDEAWNWQNEEDYWKKIHELHDVLRRYNVHYSLRTYERGKEDFTVGGYP
ncbi:MAG: hypothetical protein KAU99_01050 [Thermoplasmata archaeon]|nr:hypothetical protein [Thermoplasmata archaeon]